MLVVVCCGCVVVLCSCSTFYLFCSAERPTHADISPLFNARTNAKLLPPSPADTLSCIVDVSAHIKIGVAVRLGLHFEGRKYAFFAH